MPKREHEESKVENEAADTEQETLSEEELENVAGGAGAGRYGYDGSNRDDGGDAQGAGRYGYTGQGTRKGEGSGVGRYSGLGRYANVGKFSDK